MKPPAIPLEKITALLPIFQAVIPSEYRDENGHMNVRYYMTLFDEAGYPLVARIGLTPDYHRLHGTGGFDLEQHLHYLNEVLIGDHVTVYARLLARSAKRIHYMLFMVNDTRQSLASIFECVNSFADLTVRRTAPYPPDIAQRIDELIEQDRRLDWPAPVCGVISA